jgi:DNA invertase Pin-like site-specific DNA recombinase
LKAACKLVGYRRVSTARQGASGLGLEAQDAAIAAYVAATGCNLVSTFTEVESGKRSTNRPQLLAALAHARRIGATMVIAKMDRLARNIAFISALMESGVDFVACDNPHANRLTVHILAAVAEDESRRISTRTKEALAAYKARGGVLGTDNLTNAGRAKGNQALVAAIKATAVAAYADLVPLMVSMKKDGKTLQEIAAHLNSLGHTTRTGMEWSKVQVKRAIDRSN